MHSFFKGFAIKLPNSKHFYAAIIGQTISFLLKKNLSYFLVKPKVRKLFCFAGCICYLDGDFKIFDGTADIAMKRIELFMAEGFFTVGLYTLGVLFYDMEIILACRITLKLVFKSAM